MAHTSLHTEYAYAVQMHDVRYLGIYTKLALYLHAHLSSRSDFLAHTESRTQLNTYFSYANSV